MRDLPFWRTRSSKMQPRQFSTSTDRGLSLLSISHRTKDFDDVMAEADALFRELLHIPDNYKIIYLGGGASTFFSKSPPTSWVRRPVM